MGTEDHILSNFMFSQNVCFLCFRRTCVCYGSQDVCLSRFLSKKHRLRKKKEPQHLQILLNPKPKSKNH